MDELKKLYDEDQRDRHERLMYSNPGLFIKRDAERLGRVVILLQEARIITPADHLHAAMIFQHGRETWHYEKAHELAKKAVDMGYKPEKDEPDPLWLAAAAKDRALMSQGKPQLYGTQFRKDLKENRWYLYETDPTVTDKERAKWHVPPLSEAYKRVEKMNQKNS